MRHVIWDWNGTLLDDLEIVVESVNVAIAPFDRPHIDADGYRDSYQRPVQRFYDVLLGRPVTDDEWRSIDHAFHLAYRNRVGAAGLHHTALEALDLICTAGRSQSVLSMWWHHELVPAVRDLGIDGYMVRVDGNDGDAGERKAGQLSTHLDRIGDETGVDRNDVVMIGDTFDDGDAAGANGISCVLFAGGSHHRHQLVAAGWPVADSLTEALRIAGVV